jgi:excisionase family DNA binding protein
MTYTLDNISEIFPNATRPAIRRAIKEQGLPAQKIGRNWYFDAEAVRGWLSGQKERQAHERRKRAVRVSQDDPSRYQDEIGE